MKKARKTASQSNPATHAKPEELARFSALADTWWNPSGPMAPLHKLNPVRLAYIEEKITAHFGKKKNVSVLDVGCAAGLVSEGLARKGFQVTGLDASEKLVEAAKAHARAGNLNVSYRCGEADELLANKETFDVVLALEVIEHVDEQEEFVRKLAALTKKGGLTFISTLNRSAKGFLLGIVGAEYIMRWLPIGTHDWRAFVRPSELTGWMKKAGLEAFDVTGLCYDPLRSAFFTNPRDVDVNYIVVAKTK